MTERQGILNEMQKIENYLLRCSGDKELFKPESDCAKRIREQLEQKQKLTEQEAQSILDIYNDTNSQKHYNGTGWADYQLHLRHLLSVDGIAVEIDELTGRMKIRQADAY